MIPFSLSRSSRRAFARSSKMESAGVSSTYKSRFERPFNDSVMRLQSFASRYPPRTFERLTRASEHRIRCINCTALISSEKNAVVAPDFAAFTARFRANEVLPTPGRAARITRSPPRNPPNSASTSRKPDGTPAICDCWSASLVISSNVSVSSSSALRNVDEMRFSVAANRVFSASSTTTFKSSGGLYASALMSLDARIRSRSTAMRFTMSVCVRQLVRANVLSASSRR